jgi:hypothetical protein
MGMTFVIAMSGVSVAACLVTLNRVIGWQRILRYATLVDVGFTIGLGVLFMGTLTGMLVAVLGGLLMALTLTIAKRIDAAQRALRAQAKPVYPDEYNANGWVYNQAPYI